MIRTTFKIFSRISNNRPNLLLLGSKFLGFIDPLNLGTLIQKERVCQGHSRSLHFEDWAYLNQNYKSEHLRSDPRAPTLIIPFAPKPLFR